MTNSDTPSVAPGGTPLLGRRVQIAGSASPKTDATLTRYAHDIVADTVRQIMNAGGGLVLAAGKEPRPAGARADAPSLVFDWTALEMVADCLRRGCCAAWQSKFGLPIVVTISEKAESEIPDERRPLYQELLDSGRVHLELIMAGSRSATLIRQRQANFGDALVILGGGTGVEHLADLYLARRKPVVPLDLAIGASREDGTGGASGLAKQARAEPRRFLRFSPAFVGTEGAAFAGVATRNGNTLAAEIADRTVTLLTKNARPNAFCVRLLNPAHAKFPSVESFFREVIDPVIEEAGMNRVEIGTNQSEHSFINVAIFESLHFSSLAIVDVTGERPNCFIELGYALGNGNRLLITAEDGTNLPFDQQAIPCHFWKSANPVSEQKRLFIEFWEKNIRRPPIVKTEP